MMDTHSETTLDKIVLREPLYQSTLPAGSSTLIDNSFTEEPTHQKKRTSQLLTDSQEEGVWICGTDLLQMGAVRKRPRLLPHGVKMFVYIENESKKMMDFPSCNTSQLTIKKTETEELCDGKELYNMKLKIFSDIHPKKRFLQRFLQCDKCY